MKIDIDGLTEQELIDLNHRVVERLRFLESMRAHAEMMEFSVGEKVRFRASGRESVIGVLVKYNKKTVTEQVPDDDDLIWSTPAFYRSLTREYEALSKQVSGTV